MARFPTRAWLGIVAIVAIIQRGLLYWLYRPVTYHDTANYRRLAEAILHGWRDYDGTRTPGFPLLMALAGPDEHVYAVQLALGLLTTLLFFYIGWRLSGRGWFGALAALAHTLNLQQLFFEADLLTECLATFFIAASLAALAWLLYSDRERPLWQVLRMALASGLAAGLATSTRPLFIFLPLWAAFFLVAAWRAAAPRVRWAAALVTALAGLALIGGWVNFIHQRYGPWSLTVMTGYHLVQHTGLFFEYVPDEYAAIRDTFIPFREARIVATGEPGNAIWDAIPALSQVSGLGMVPLSNLLAKISIQLILQHPGLYLKSVWLGWLWYWKAPVYWAPEVFTNPALHLILSGKVAAARGVIVTANVAFLLGSAALASRKVRQILKPDAFNWFVASTLWLTSLIQTLLDHGDNPRFSVPTQSVLILLVLWWGIKAAHYFTKRKLTGDEQV
jgi:4-amino-4-deoxy-L-arabinose transferase-like glycosyltransferase